MILVKAYRDLAFQAHKGKLILDNLVSAIDFLLVRCEMGLPKVLKYKDTQHHYFSICSKLEMMVFRCPSL